MLSIIIPCFNERLNIESFSSDLFPILELLKSPFEVIAVDDGSQDGSREALEALQKGKKLRLVIHGINQGLGAALQSGFLAAQGDWLVTLDADLSFSPKDIDHLLRRQKETNADMVSGSPFIGLHGLKGVSWKRQIPSRILNSFYQVFLGAPFSSFTPIFRLYRASALKSLDLKSAGFEINAEIAAAFLIKKFKIAEEPVSLSLRRFGKSKLKPMRELMRHAYLIWQLVKMNK